jgi:hypothetical protein
MKKILGLLTLLALPCSLLAQTNSLIYFYHHNGGGNSSILCLPTGTNYLATGGLGDGTAAIAFFSTSNSWVVSGLTTGNEWTMDSVPYPSNGQVYALYGSTGPLLDTWSNSCTLTFNNFSAPALILQTASLTNFWPAGGGAVNIAAQGVADTNSAVILTLNSNVLFESSPNLTPGLLWTLRSQLQLDSSNNLNVATTLNGGPAGFVSLTNFAGTNMNLSLAADATMNTNVIVTGVQVTGGQAVNGAQPFYVWPPAGTSGGGVTNFVFAASSVASTSAPVMAIVGVTNNIAYCFVQIPAGAPGAPGAPGTNTVSVTNVYTAYNPSNCILTGSRFTITNIATLNFAGTNFIGRFPQVDSYTLHVPNIGGGGLDPGVPEFEQVWLNYTATNWSGTNGWFLPTSSMNTMVYTNVAVAVVGAVGNTGALDIYGMDHPPQAGVYNMIYRQGIGTQMTPTLPTDLVNLQYLQNYVGQYFASPVYKFIDTNSLTHVQIINGSQLLLDVTSMNYYLTVSSIKAVGTNIQMGVALSNYVPGYQFQISTNMLAAGSGFVTSTNFTISTNAGMVIFTTPMLSTYAYYRQLFTQLPMAKFYSPLAADLFIIPSNSWATLYSEATNKLSPGGTALNINSNGSSQLWKIYDSNGVFLVSPQ